MADPQPSAPTELTARADIAPPAVKGKFLWASGAKLLVRGVTYGTFAPNQEGGQYPDAQQVHRDFQRMTAHAINAIRTYTVPPTWILDLAHRYGMYVLVGLPWEQHVAFLDDRRLARSIEGRVRSDVESCGGHPAVLAYVVGNEIPSSIVRWHGRARTEKFIGRLCAAVKDVDPSALVTYANYPSTEYLDPPLSDFVCFNVFLEAEQRLAAYLARLQNIAGDRPLIISELGLDSRRHGDLTQALSIRSQLTTVLEAGCAGAFVFSWTDEWHRNGVAVDDWDFGLVRRSGQPKPALAAVGEAYAEAPFSEQTSNWPSISVVVCTHNGAATLDECLTGLADVDYPDFEVIVVDDGSSDDSAEIAARHRVRLIRTEPQGLSSARNAGLAVARSEIVAYVDDDAWPDRDWLKYLALSFMRSNYAGIGGPNIPPPDEGVIPQSIARAPGGPIHVMLSDLEAEHIPGCNMAFRRSALEAVGGFDSQFWVAGDDVDMCWRLQAMGWTLGFSPAAMVWHRRRRSVRAYLRQQAGYGKAEALLERKWPEHYNGGGHVKWAGRVYSGRALQPNSNSFRIYYGLWGTAMFQSIYERRAGWIASLPLMPQSYLLMVTMALLIAGGLLWPPLLIRLPGIGLPVPLLLLTGAMLALAGQAVVAGWHAFPNGLTLRAATSFLYLAQPVARLWGRVRHGLTPWRRRGRPHLGAPWPHNGRIWSEAWQPLGAWARGTERELQSRGVETRRGSAFDRWDVEVDSGMLAAVRLRLGVEEHGHGHQLVRARWWPRLSGLAAGLVISCAGLNAVALLGRANIATVIALSTVLGFLLLRLVVDIATAMGICDRAFSAMAVTERPSMSPDRAPSADRRIGVRVVAPPEVAEE